MSKSKECLEQIELKRSELITIVARNGLSSHLAIELSQQLDQLLNMYHKKHYKAGTELS
ncbi:Spo0E family sporulation regulatory protein-aspartic acid phosphatase [Peribacillus sp. NPDC097295]|uniref:Spo0E family sporulation regulatory protein-aspartic acid phosphatase n=1 Tax=Peribacillus sp. NPDC097295 TaxID=3364402 RepID=UPI003830426C